MNGVGARIDHNTARIGLARNALYSRHVSRAHSIGRCLKFGRFDLVGHPRSWHGISHGTTLDECIGVNSLVGPMS